MHPLQGKVAFITGGDSGIGLGIARAMLSAGMNVVITYLTEAHLEEALRTLADARERLHAIRLDVTDRAGMLAAADETLRVFGKVHVLVNNAGVASMLPLSCATFEDWDWCVNVNINGVFNGVRAFLPRIKAHGEGGHIVATSSLLGGVVVGPFWGVYSTSKFAVTGMMEALRAELSGTNIGVSVFCPAGVSSNLGASERNRPASLRRTEATDAGVLALLGQFDADLEKVVEQTGERQAFMDPLEAGERVVRGILNDDLYILSHPEYEPVIRERNGALLASIPRNQPDVGEGRRAIARLARTPIYLDEMERKAAAKARST